MSISADKLDKFTSDIKSLCESAPPEYFLISETMKHSLDVLISQRPHVRRLRKVVYRRIYARREAARRRKT